MSICTKSEAGDFLFSNFSDFSNQITKCLNKNFKNRSDIALEQDDFNFVSRQDFILVCSILLVACLSFVVSSVVLYAKIHRIYFVDELRYLRINCVKKLRYLRKKDKTVTTTENEWNFNDKIREKLIPINKITTNFVVGRGEFSIVYFGQMLTNAVALLECSSELRGNTVDVAIKVPAKYIENMDMVVNEVHILNDIGHHLNVVEFYGFSLGNFSRKEIYILTEFCENGSLLKYLRSCYREIGKDNRKIRMEHITLLRFAHEISLGMEYLNFQNIIHGDLAARNVFIDAAFICKIGDFGLSFKQGVYNNLSCNKIPWKWRAPEAIKSNITTKKSDVWSYGVTIWEIFSLGFEPYPCVSYSELVTFPIDNNRLDKPRYASREIYKIMLKCWRQLPEERPSFYVLVKDIAKLRKAYDIIIEQTQKHTSNNQQVYESVV